MIIEATTLLSLFTQLREWIVRSDAKRVRESQEMRNALRAIYIATFETRAYLASVKAKPDSRSLEGEANLAKL